MQRPAVLLAELGDDLGIARSDAGDPRLPLILLGDGRLHHAFPLVRRILAERRARDSNPQPLAGHHISSWTGQLSTTVRQRPKPYTVAEFGETRVSTNVSPCSPV